MALSADLTDRGMTDVETAWRVSDDAFRHFRDAQIPLISGEVSRLGMGLLAMLTRAEAFHSGALQMIRADNPFATYALIRSYAENAAALIWIPERAVHGRGADNGDDWPIRLRLQALPEQGVSSGAGRDGD